MQHRVPVIILAGGLGTRLWPLFKDRPKPMAEILNKPFLEYIILNLKYQAFTDIILAVSYMKEFVVEYFGDGSEFGVHIKYSVEDVPLGTGGAIKRASMMVDEERFICMNGDTFSDVSLFDLLHYHLAKNAKITLALKAVEDRARYGSVDIDRNGKILTFDEKRFKGAGLINTGVYVFEKSIFENIKPHYSSLERDILPYFIGNDLYGMPSSSYFVDIGTPESFLSLAQKPEGFMKAVMLCGGHI